MKRLDYIDLAKGIGILLVVLGHSSLTKEYITAYIYSFHMPLFFVIAGMLIYVTETYTRSLKTIILGRLRTLMVPYVIFSIIYTLIDLIKHDTYTKTNAIYSLCLQGSGPLWFLPTLFISEILFIILIKYCRKIGGSIVALLLGFVALFISGIHLLAEPGQILWGLKDNMLGIPRNPPGALVLVNFNLAVGTIILVALRCLSCLVFLCAGFWLIRILSRIKSNALSNALSFAGGVILLVLTAGPTIVQCLNGRTPFIANMSYMELYPSLIIFIVCSLTGSTGLILLCKGLNEFLSRRFLCLIGKPLRFWGRNSLLIMVTHLNCQVLFLGNLFAVFMNQYITRARVYIFRFNIIFICMLTETILILLVNRFCPWIIGKKKENRPE